MLDPLASGHLTPMLHEAIATLTRSVLFFLDRTSPLYWPYLLSTIVLGWIGWRWFEHRIETAPGNFAGRHFGKALWWHPSARVDYAYYLVNAIIFVLLIVPLLLSSAWLADRVRDGLQFLYGYGQYWTPGIGTRVIYTLLFFVAYDFGRWLAHTLLHEVPLLWEFHKTHHSAEVLTPITAFRVHPLDLLLTLSVPAVTTAPVTGLFLYCYPGTLDAYSFLGLNFVIGLSGLIANLKHSQVWFRYGWLDGWWISPAHHQIHHSADPKHWGKNRGFELGIWDRWYGSLHVPSREREVVTMGLGDGTDGTWHRVHTLYFRPFVMAFRRLRPAGIKTATTAAVVLLALSSPRARAEGPQSPQPPATVYLEEMTWPELSAAIAAGRTTVLVPIGGTEQNGPGMAFSKHNDIVRYAAGEIAQRNGHAIVAPVLPFAPEGSFVPRTGNLQWPGTIGLRETTLAAVLEDEVTSLVLAGFRSIVFLGDHGGSQPVQAEIVRRLGSVLASRGIVVASLDRYYEPASLADRLKALGVDPAISGDHAGLVDTAELMSVKPEAIRRERLDPKTWSAYAKPEAGASGRPDLATAELGRGLLEQRIAAGVTQLGSLTATK